MTRRGHRWFLAGNCSSFVLPRQDIEERRLSGSRDCMTTSAEGDPSDVVGLGRRLCTCCEKEGTGRGQGLPHNPGLGSSVDIP
jgi:hypothetical protein